MLTLELHEYQYSFRKLVNGTEKNREKNFGGKHN